MFPVLTLVGLEGLVLKVPEQHTRIDGELRKEGRQCPRDTFLDRMRRCVTSDGAVGACGKRGKKLRVKLFWQGDNLFGFRSQRARP